MTGTASSLIAWCLPPAPRAARLARASHPSDPYRRPAGGQRVVVLNAAASGSWRRAPGRRPAAGAGLGHDAAPSCACATTPADVRLAPFLRLKKTFKIRVSGKGFSAHSPARTRTEMSSRPARLDIRVVPGDGADAQAVAEDARPLRRELLVLDVDAVDVPRSADVRPRLRGAGAAALGALVVTIAQAQLPPPPWAPSGPGSPRPASARSSWNSAVT
jgi:hypothetical protein